VRAPASAEGRPSERVLRAPALTVEIDEVMEPERLTYAAESAANLVHGADLEPTASSSIGEGPPRGAIDGRASSSWSCAPSDAAPWLAIAFERAVKAERVALVHSEPRRGRSSVPRAAEIDVVINGKERHRLAMRPDRTLKTYLDLPKPTAIRELRIEIASSVGRRPGRDSVGLAEVELLRRSKAE
jgi:hypothetical protein